LNAIADEAIARQATIENVIVVKRTEQEIYMEAGRDYWYHDLMSLPVATSSNSPTEKATQKILFSSCSLPVRLDN